MSSSSYKIGFWSTVSIVIGSQIGSGIFMLPSTLAPFGTMGVLSWGVTGIGAILLALVFSRLCCASPKTGGPHTYVLKAFGQTAGFFTAWTYWVISWVSSTAVVIATVGYLGSLVGGLSPLQGLIIEIALLLVFMGVNLLGLKASGKAEFVFTVLKVVPLLILPLACLPFIETSHFSQWVPSSDMSPLSALNAAAILTFWGFIGVETATTPAESVCTPHKTIPRAIVLGTLLVALLYMASSAALMGVIPTAELASSQAPFVDLTHRLFGHESGKFIALCAVIVCVGTLNAWILTSGQVALGAAKDGFLPSILSKTNKNGAPTWAIIVSCVGVIPLLFLSLDNNLTAQLTNIIDVSVAAFIYVYTVCVLAYLKLEWKNKKVTSLLLGALALVFCSWAIFVVDFMTLLLSFSIILTGLPIFIYKCKGANCFQVCEDRQ